MKKDDILKKWKEIKEQASGAERIILVGAAAGTDMQSILSENGISVHEYFDNSEKFVGTYVNGIEVKKPHKLLGENVLYIICCKTEKNRQELHEQLIKLEIEPEQISFAPTKRPNSLDVSRMSMEEIKDRIGIQYLSYTGRELNFDSPTLFTEKLNIRKIDKNDKRFWLLSDKYLVKEYVKNVVGDKYVVPLLGVWDDACEIDYDKLPEKFVLKTNCATNCNIIVKDKTNLNIEETNLKLNGWLKQNLTGRYFEFQYYGIQPKIICEEYLEGVAEEIYDYQFFCFNGEPRFIWCINGSHREGCRASFYDLNWNILPVSWGYPKDDIVAPRPKNLDEMLEVSRVLSRGLDHVRVDLYDMPDGRVLFGEMTFQTWAGLRSIYPIEFDEMWGKYLQ